MSEAQPIGKLAEELLKEIRQKLDKKDSEFLSCPFCGGNDIWAAGSQSWAVKCHTCYSKVQCADTRQDAVKKWNTRA